jgi:ATP-dependent helicase/nuclease subunit A
VTIVPHDHDTRARLVNDVGTTFFVEAGAGTGKTTVLIDRIVKLITSGAAGMDQIAAITFTEAAAAELRDRLAQKFEELATGAPDDLVGAAIDALDAAAVTTLHGFARKLLAEQPFVVGLPPLFDVADASASRVAFDERWERLVTDLLENPTFEDLVVRALGCGMTWKNLRAAALECEENWDRLTPSVAVGTPAPSIDATPVLALLAEAADLVTQCADPSDRLAVHLVETTTASNALIGRATDEIDLLQILATGPKLTAGNAGAQANWARTAAGLSCKQRVHDLLNQAEDERTAIVDRTGQWVLQSLFSLLVTFTLGAAEERRHSGHLSFHDLLVLARELVRDQPGARAELHQRYTHILIDEFQDTDPIQAEVAMYLAAGPDVIGDGGEKWSDLAVPPGRLFFVGDPKQSIYRFRRADIDLFNRIRDDVVGQAEQLTTNFRSRPQIVDWANAIFSDLFKSSVPTRQAAYEALQAHNDHGHDNPRQMAPVVVLGRHPMAGNAEDVRRQQAADVISALSAMHTEQWPIGEGGRPMRYSDVAILVRTRTGLPVLEDACRAAGVPYRLESSSLVYESAEVQQLLAILRAIDDPTDAVSVLAALRSPAFGCGDDDLFEHRAAGGRWDTRSAAPVPGPVKDGLASLASYHDTRWWENVSTLVSHVVTDRRLLPLALAAGRPRESWRRVRYLMDQARLFDESNGGDLRSFLRWVDHQSEEGAKVTEAILPESDDDAVRISTVHAAKGLEFPVTVLLGLQTASNSERPTLLFGPDGPELCLKKAFETPGYEGALAFEREMARLEQQRLLYVAATRACDVLVVSVHRDSTAKTTLAAQVVECCDAHPALWSDGSALCAAGAGAARVGSTERAAQPDDDADQRARFAALRTEALARAAIPRTVAATAVQRLAAMTGPTEAGDDGAVEPLERADTQAVQRRGRAGTAVGRAVHAVLQLIDLRTGDDLEAMADAQAAAEGVAERSAEVRRLVRAALDSDLVREAVSGERFWREVYVGVPVGERVLEGFIDLLFETPGGLAIVDYKTDHLADGEDAGSLARRYRLQGASYALAVEEVLGRPVVSCSFLILTPSGSLATPIPDLDLAVSEVREALGQGGIPLHLPRAI